MSARARVGLVLVAVVLTASLVWAEFYLQSRNTLLQNGNWISSKQRMQLHLVGAIDFLEARQPLAKNQLDLGTWSGFNEVLLNRVVEPLGVRLRFALEDRAHLSLLFARDATGYAGFRVSRHPEIASGFFEATPAGRFTRFEAVDHDPGDGWHVLEVELDPNEAIARVDDRELARLTGRFDGPQTIGMRSGMASARVDDVEVVLRSGEVVSDDFRRSEGRWRATLFFAVLITVIAALPAAIAALAGGRGRAPVFAFALCALVALAIGAALLAVDALYWSSHYFYRTPGIRLASARGIPLAAEKARRWFFEETLPGWIGDPVVARPLPEPFVEDAIVRRGRPPRGPSEEFSLYSSQDPSGVRFVPFANPQEIPPKAPGVVRIAFVGSSQAWGAGAESPHDTFVARVHRRIASLLPSARVETLNLAINGTNTYEYLPFYMQISGFVQPDLVVVDFGNNDRNPHEFADHLHGFIEWNERLRADTILLREANSIEHPAPLGLAAKHARIDAVGEARGVRVLDLHGFVNSPEVVDSGFLWWDYVHFSSYGHERVAEWLAPQIAAVLRARLRGDAT